MTNKFLKRFGVSINRYTKQENTVVSLKPEKKPKGNVLLSYIIDPFFVSDEKLISNSHHHDWLSWQIAQTFLRFNYAVDAIDYRNNIFKPEKKYSFFVGARTNFQRITKLLNKDCFKIVHLDTAHWLFSNLSAYKRCIDIQKRRKTTLKSYKMIETNLAIEYADMATTNLGNQFNVSTYEFAQKPIYQIPLPTCTTYPWPKEKDFAKCKRNFLWIGSNGLVHKGLDLVLEAFADLPEYNLIVCGPIKSIQDTNNSNKIILEHDFEEAYQKELFDTPNIHTTGWVDIESNQFLDILNSCVAIIFPSCSEGGGASAITCMQAGLIPCVSFESNVEVRDFGITLNHSSIDEIKQAIQSIGTSTPENLARRARQSWEFAQTYHTKDFFEKEYDIFVSKILSTNQDDAMKYNRSIVERYRRLS